MTVGHLQAWVSGSMNAVMVKSDAAGVTIYYGGGINPANRITVICKNAVTARGTWRRLG